MSAKIFENIDKYQVNQSLTDIKNFEDDKFASLEEIYN